MPFGLAGSPGEFKQLTSKILGSLKDAEDWSDMIMKLRMVLEKLRIANRSLKLSKYSFGARKIEFLGFVIGGGQISPGTVKSQAIEKFPTPKDVHGVCRFLGLTGFFRCFVRNYVTLAELLSKLTKKGVMFEWPSPQKMAFNEMNKVFTNASIFCMFDLKAAVTEVHTDASSIGLGTMLLQSK